MAEQSATTVADNASKQRRLATAIRFKPELHERLVFEAEAREVSINWLVNRAVADFLDRLIPVEELRLTR